MTSTTTSTQVELGTHHSWVPYVAVASGACLLLKAVLIIATEDGVADVAEVGLYLGGILLALAAAIGAGLRSRHGRRAVTAVGLCLLVVFYVMGLSDGVEALFAPISDAPWVRDEGPVGLLGVILLALGARGRGSDRQEV